MRFTPLPAGGFDPHEFSSRTFGPADFAPADFGPADFAPADFGPADFGPADFRAGRGRNRRRQLREAMLAMSGDDVPHAPDGSDRPGPPAPADKHGLRGEGHRRGRRRGGFGGPGGPGFGGTGGPGFSGQGGPGFGGSGFGGPFGRGPKAGRGDIRAGILVLLAEQPRHGYEIIRQLVERSGGAWRASPGSIYPTLKRLAQDGLVQADKGDGRRVFELTESGRAYVQEHAEELAAPWDALADDVDDPFVQLRDLTGQVAGAVMQVAQAGTSEQVAAAAALLTETRRALYRILAEDPPSPDAQ